MADKDFKVKSGLDLGTPLPLTEGGTGQTSASNALNALLPLQTSNSGKVLSTDGTSTSWVTLPNGYSKGDTASRPGSPALGDIYSNTETGYIEVYTSAGWSQLGVIPESATIGTATDVGTNRPYNNGAISVSFTPSTGGGLVSRFTATSTTGGYSAFASSSPIIVPDIPVGTSATFTVTATNGYGNALPTTASNSATTTTVPQVPTIGTASNPSGSAYASTAPASVTFTAGATGGKTVSNYKYSTDGSTYTALSPSQTTSPLSIPGLTSGQSYTIRLKAINANGDSTATSESNSVTISTVPQSPTIGTATLASGQSYSGSALVSVPFTPGSNGQSSLVSPFYTVTSSSGATATGSSSPISISETVGSGTSRTYTVTAVNANGTSESSSNSNSITPASVPQSPTIGTATIANSTTVSLAFTPGATGGSEITSYVVTSSPSVSLSTSGTSSPLTVTGSFELGTSYTFVITAVNSQGNSVESSSSNSIIPNPAVYSLSQTFNSSGTYTVPSGKKYISAYVFGGGGSGASGNAGSNPKQFNGLQWIGGNGGSGGSGGGGSAFSGYSVTPGETFTVTVAAGGGASSFGNIALANGGTTSTPGSGSSNVAGAVIGSGGSGGGGGAGSGENANADPIPGGNAGSSGSGQTLVLNDAGLVSLQVGGGGGGGGGGRSPANSPRNNPSNGSSSGGGNGGTSPGSSGNSGSANTGGGGGGGGGGDAASNSNSPGGSGASGASGRVVIYTA